MCKLGDIIVVDKYIGEDGSEVNKYSFVVINDQPDFIEGLKYDFVTNVMSSFKSAEHRIRKLKFMENVEIVSEDIISNLPKNAKNGFVKADQLIYFDKNKINYYVLGHVSEELLNKLMLVMFTLSKHNKLRNNTNNLVHTAENNN